MSMLGPRLNLNRRPQMWLTPHLTIISAASKWSKSMSTDARAIVDSKIAALQASDDRFLLLDQELWAAFIKETGMAPDKIEGSDERILYRGVELRESAAG